MPQGSVSIHCGSEKDLRTRPVLPTKDGIDGEVEQHEKSAEHAGLETGKAAKLKRARKQTDLPGADRHQKTG